MRGWDMPMQLSVITQKFGQRSRRILPKIPGSLVIDRPKMQKTKHESILESVNVTEIQYKVISIILLNHQPLQTYFCKSNPSSNVRSRASF